LDKKRLVIITDAWYPQINGVVTTLQNMVEQGEKNGYDVHVIHPEMFTCRFYPRLYPEVPVTLPFGISRILRDLDPDYIHVATEGPLGLCASILLFARMRKYTTSYHTSWGPFLRELYGIPEWVTLRYLKWFHQKKTVLCPTEDVKSFLVENKIGRKPVVWSRGVNLEQYGDPVLELHNEKPVLLSVGRVSKEKNLDEFCSIDHEKYDLVLVGDGPYLPELRAKYPWVKFTGYKTGQELVDLYKSADCFVFNSLNDTFGIVMIEAMVSGTPVAAHAVRGPIDVVDHGITGFLHEDIETAVKECLSLSRKDCAACARSQWSWEKVWNTFIGVVSVFAKKRRAPASH